MSDAKRIIHGKEFVFYDREHLYTWGGQSVPGVTTILNVISKGPRLEGWLKNQVRNHWLAAVKSGRTDFDKIHKESWGASDRTKQDAADIGTNVHKYAEHFFKGLELPELETEAAKIAVGAFHDWLKAHKVEVLKSEHLVFSRNYFYAGTCDFIAKIDGELCVGDIKTSSGIYNVARFQTAAYQQAIQEETGEKFPVRWIARFDKKTGQFEAKPFRDFALDFAAFEAALTLHKAIQTIEEQAG